MADKIWHFLDREDGGSLLELVVCVPAVLVVMATMIASLCFVSNNFMRLSGDWELLEEVRGVTEQLSQDIRYAQEIQVIGGGIRIKPYQTGSTDQWDIYQLKNSGNNYILQKNSQPLTGNTQLASIGITDFSFTRLAPYKFQMHIAAKNKNTDMEYRLDTVVYSYSIWKRSMEKSL